MLEWEPNSPEKSPAAYALNPAHAASVGGYGHSVELNISRRTASGRKGLGHASVTNSTVALTRSMLGVSGTLHASSASFDGESKDVSASGSSIEMTPNGPRRRVHRKPSILKPERVP